MLQNRLLSTAASRRNLTHITLLLLATWGGCSALLSERAIADEANPAELPGAAELLQTAPAPVAPAPRPVPAPAAAPAASAPTPVRVEATASPAAIAPPEVQVEPQRTVDPVSRNAVPLPHSEVFIDATDYNLGATPHPQRPAIVFSERSTGCEQTLQAGQAVPAQLCQSTTVAQRGGAASGGGSEGQVNRASQNLLDRVVGQTTAASRDYFNRGARALNRLRRGEYRFVFPLTVPAPVTSAFGWRIHPITGDQRFHAGTDIGAPLGTPIVAARSGRVVMADFFGGYGLAVVMNHADESNRITEQSLYAHMARILVQTGDWVEQGEVIGLVGSTGNSTGPHLHFELKQLTATGWALVDPGQLLTYTLADLTGTLDRLQAGLLPADLDQPRDVKIALKANAELAKLDWSEFQVQPGAMVQYAVAQLENMLASSKAGLKPTRLAAPLPLPKFDFWRSPDVELDRATPQATDIPPAPTK